MEFVFVVPRNALFRDFYPQGLATFAEDSQSVASAGPPQRPFFSREIFESAVENEGFFVERAYAERRPELKQVIPYSIVECSGRLLCVRRLGTGGESRLFDKHSIGIGGHIDPQDVAPQGRSPLSSPRPSLAAQARGPSSSSPRATCGRNPIEAGARRELEEELTVRGAYDLRPVGILNDDSNPVGAVHVGVVHLISVQGSVEIREKDQLEGRLVAADELAAMLAEGANFETWSSLLIPRLDEILPNTTAAGRFSREPMAPRETPARTS